MHFNIQTYTSFQKRKDEEYKEMIKYIFLSIKTYFLKKKYNKKIK